MKWYEILNGVSGSAQSPVFFRTSLGEIFEMIECKKLPLKSFGFGQLCF